jgi:alpha-L-arabinofuranosidase
MELGEYIDEVLALIEYANGSEKSEWGALRAAHGHPVSFGLKYLAIGNEDQQTSIFRTRFTAIRDAVRSRHPEITIIGTSGPAPFGTDFDDGWSFARQQGLDLVDEHGYKSPRWLFENLDRYDHYDRSGPGVYLGEYGSKGNTLLNALAEAAYMMALERNGDIVRLASYAPLLAKVDHTQWVPDLIYFDNQRVLRTANYWVQQMHSLNSGDSAIPVRVENAPTFVRPASEHSSIAFRADRAEVVFTDIHLATEMIPEVVVRDTADEVALKVSTRHLDYSISLRAKLNYGESGFVVAFGAVGTPDHFEWNFGTWKNRFLTLFAKYDGHLDELVQPLPFTVEPGREYKIEIEVTSNGQHVTCRLDDEVVHDVDTGQREECRFSATALRNSADGTVILKVVNATSEATTVELLVPPDHEFSAARRTILSGDPDAGKPFEESPVQPLRDEPVDLRSLGIPPYSFTVFELL